MRDKQVHHYFGVDLIVLWRPVEEDVPVLIPVIQDVIEREDASA